MSLSAEQLSSIARNYWCSTSDHDFKTENSPEYERLCALWEQQLKKIEEWSAFLDDLERELPDFTIGNATATLDACFRCVAYSDKGCPRPTFRFAAVGCVSILAPIYTVYGVQYDFISGKRHNPRISFEPLPPEMRIPADVIARKIEKAFGVTALPREIAETPIPLIVHWKEPPDTTLFHALFTYAPERLP
jgi:hypothetical protein